MKTQLQVIKQLKKKIFIAGILLAFFILGFFVFQSAGIWLFYKEQVRKADAILILMGSTGDRSLHAYDLYAAGYANHFIMVSDNETARDLLASRGIYFQNESDKTRQVLVQLGTPDSLITTISGSAKSTGEEAILLHNYLLNNPELDTLLLVTSASHALRASLTMRESLSDLNNKLVIISCPSTYSEFNADRWWTDRESAKQVVMEYTRLAYFWFWDRFE